MSDARSQERNLGTLNVLQDWSIVSVRHTRQKRLDGLSSWRYSWGRFHSIRSSWSARNHSRCGADNHGRRHTRQVLLAWVGQTILPSGASI